MIKDFVKKWILPQGLIELSQRARNIRKRYFERTTEERALLEKSSELLNRHAGSRVFILGAGSSVSAQDITKLKGEIVIGVSNTFVHPDYLTIQPRYHVLPSLLESHGVYHSAEKFAHWLKEMELGTGNVEMIMHIGDRKMVLDYRLFNGRVIHWVDYCHWNGDFGFPVNLARIPHVWSVSETAITSAVFMGFEKIFLIGFDHDWFRGALVYFYDHSKQHALKPNQTNLEFVDAEFQMLRHAEIFRKYKYLQSIKGNIYNANSDSAHYLDTFPKVDFDSIFCEK